MNVAYVTMQFPTPSETFAARDVTALRELGVNVSVYSLRPPHRLADSLCEERELAGISLVHGDIKTMLKGLVYSLSHLRLLVRTLLWVVKSNHRNPVDLIKCLLLLPACFGILDRLLVHKPDVVHLFWGHYPSILGYLIRNSPIEARVTGFLGSYDLERGVGLSRWLAQHGDMLFTHASANLSIIEALGGDPSRIEVVYRGLDLKEFPPVTFSDVKGRKNQIYTAGRLIREKGFGKAIRLVARLKKVGLRVPLVISGDGPERKSLEALRDRLGVSDLVTFTGYVSQNEVRNWMRTSKLFVLFSTYRGERLPNVVKEAMVSGCVCLVSPSKGVEELVEHEVNGFILESEVYEAVPIVQRAVQDATFCQNISANAIQKLKEEFDVLKLMRQYKRVWSNLINFNSEKDKITN